MCLTAKEPRALRARLWLWKARMGCSVLAGYGSLCQTHSELYLLLSPELVVLAEGIPLFLILGFCSRIVLNQQLCPVLSCKIRLQYSRTSAYTDKLTVSAYL